MPAIAAITLDGNAGVDHVFAPKTSDMSKSLVQWNKAGSAPVGDERLTFSVSKSSSGAQKVTIKLVLPKTQDVEIGGVTRPSVVRTAYVTLEFTSSDSAPIDDRYEMLELVRSIVNNTTNPSLNAAIVNLEPFY